MSSLHSFDPARRGALKCLAFGGLGTVFVLAGGVLTPVELALAADPKTSPAKGVPLFLQISDTHIGFNKEANPDVAGTLKQTIDFVNAMPVKPALTIHTGDITHLSKPEEFDLAAQLMSGLKITELHTVPGEHDVTDGPGTEYFSRFGQASDNKGYYSFDHQGVHFVGLVNVMHFKPNGLGASRRRATRVARERSQVTLVEHADRRLRTHADVDDLRTVGLGHRRCRSGDELSERFGSVTVLNGHIHQIVSKVEGNITFHTARSTAYPQPTAGQGDGPGPLKVASDQLPKMLGVTSVSIARHPLKATLADTTLV